MLRTIFAEDKAFEILTCLITVHVFILRMKNVQIRIFAASRIEWPVVGSPDNFDQNACCLNAANFYRVVVL